MTKEEKIEEIDRKCRMAGCDEKLARKHTRLFLDERWDAHPPPDFVTWLRDSNPNDLYMNPATAWNSDGGGKYSDGLGRTPDRRGYNEWVALGRPEPVRRQFNREESKAKFRAAMAKIQSKTSRGHEPVVVEDTREHDY